jgi:hypothetical protein
MLEMMVALAASAIVLTAFVATSITLSRTMVAISNYNDLDLCSRITLDRLSQDVRNSSAVSSASTATSLTLSNNYDGSLITYAWDGTNSFTRTVQLNGTNSSSAMLTSCDSFAFAYFQRNPTNNLQFVSTTTAAEVKLVSVSWRCSRQVLGSKINTESVQTAHVVMRN